jgi:hypothetical protein
MAFGALYNFIEYDRLALRTGLNLGMRSMVNDYYHEGIIGCFVGELDPIKAVFAEIPFQIQLRFLENFSFDFGVSSFIQKQVQMTQIMRGLDNRSYVPTTEFAYHLGLRYTFAEKN